MALWCGAIQRRFSSCGVSEILGDGVWVWRDVCGVAGEGEYVGIVRLRDEGFYLSSPKDKHNQPNNYWIQ